MHIPTQILNIAVLVIAISGCESIPRETLDTNTLDAEVQPVDGGEDGVVSDTEPRLDIHGSDVEPLPEGRCRGFIDCPEDCQQCMPVAGEDLGICQPITSQCSYSNDTCEDGHYCQLYFLDKPACGGRCVGYRLFPVCEERGGVCTRVDNLDAPCPEPGFSPFTGNTSHCPTTAFRNCCVYSPIPGSPCETSEDCGFMSCFAEADGGPPGGICELYCDVETNDCPRWSVCAALPHTTDTTGRCVPRCEDDEGCRQDWSCEAIASDRQRLGDEQFHACWWLTPEPGVLGADCSVHQDCLSGLCVETLEGRTSVCSARCSSSTDCVHDLECLGGYCR